jgi:hypothetical protein
MVRATDVRTVCIVLLFFLLFSVVAVNVHAQVAGGTISGTVTDSSGRVINNVQITIANVATGVTRDVTTNDEGFYSAPNLLPGTYEAKFSAKGFNTEVRKGIELTVGASVGLDQTMRVGSVAETVVVQSELPAVQLSTSDISAVVNATTVRELPLNGRSWTDLAQLQAGVSAIHTQPDFSAGTDRGNRGFGQQLTISGARPQQNNYRLDGVSLNDYANGAPGSVLGGSLGVDAIQEFSVTTSNYEADYGKASGGVVNAITRSGTNQIHGSAYEFLRNSKLWRGHRRTDRKGSHMLLRRLRRHPAVEGHHNSCDRAVRGGAGWDFVLESGPREYVHADSRKRGPGGTSVPHFLPSPEPGRRCREQRGPGNIHFRRPAGGQRKLSYRASGPQVLPERQLVRYLHV